MEEKHYYLLLTYFKSFGKRIFLKLIKKAGSAESLFKVKSSFFHDIKGLESKKVDQFLEERKSFNLKEIIKDLNKKNIKYVAINQNEYPERLKNIYDPPLVLFYKGKKIKDKKYPLGVVGTRKATHYGKKTVRKFLRKFDK